MGKCFSGANVFQGRMFSGPTIFSGVNIFLGWKFFRSTHSLNIWFSQNLLGLVSLSTLDFRGWEEKFLFLLAISESFILKFSFILGTLGFWCFWMKKKSFAGYKYTFFGNFYFYSLRNMSSRFPFLVSKLKIRISNFSFYSRIRDKNSKFHFLFSNSR